MEKVCPGTESRNHLQGEGKGVFIRSCGICGFFGKKKSPNPESQEKKIPNPQSCPEPCQVSTGQGGAAATAQTPRGAQGSSWPGWTCLRLPKSKVSPAPFQGSHQELSSLEVALCILLLQGLW